MSITLEEIAGFIESINESWYLERAACRLAFDHLGRKLNDAITERAQPVTREWLDERYEFTPSPLPVWTVGSYPDGTRCTTHVRIVSEPDIKLCVVEAITVEDEIGITHWPDAFGVAITTRGQLLDLLSGLGVKK